MFAEKGKGTGEIFAPYGNIKVLWLNDIKTNKEGAVQYYVKSLSFRKRR